MKKYLFLILALCTILCISVSAVPGPAGGAGEMINLLTATPEENVTANDVVIVAARLHSLYNEGSLTQASDSKACFDYAYENGIIFEELFDSDDLEKYPVSRAELCYILANAVPEENLEAVNSVLMMPDSDVTSLYYEPALKLINAGIISGIDEYGSLGPTRSIKHYELASILKRVVNSEERIVKDYLEYASDEPYYLIDDYLMGDTTSIRGIYNISSGWRYDYTGASEKARWSINGTEDARNGYANTLRDLEKDDNITISREIFPQKDGELVLETSFNITIGFAGMRLYFEDIDGNNIFEMGTYSSGLYFMDNGVRRTRYISYPYSGTYKNDRRYYLLADPNRPSDSVEGTYNISKQIRARITINLDTGIVNVNVAGLYSTSYSYINNYTYKLKDGYNGLKKIAFSTGVAEQIEYTVKQVHLYKNYKVNDKFTTHKVNYQPYDYTTNGDAYVDEMFSGNHTQGDFYAVHVNVYPQEPVYVRKSFEEIGGLVKLESYILVPDGNDGVYFSVGYDSSTVIKIVTKDGKFYTVDKNGNPDKELRFFTPNVWQGIRIEADTDKQTALIKINGKVVAEDVPFLVKTDRFNRLELGADNPKDGFEFWFDDIEVHELFDDYKDYVPEPVPLDTGDYILSMSVCNLWRNGSHYGWSYIEPHAEIQPITGYYDEGNAEAMDWEIKFLAEHGVSTYAMCWYAPNSPAHAPVKKPRMIDAHHEGYFNARYTEYLDFSIMWENASYGTPGTSEAFKENIFPMWMDWYFSDDRYFRIEEDGKEYLFLTIYQWANFRNMCLPAKNGVYSSNVNSYYNNAEFNQAEIDAAKLVSWMEQQVIDAGYADGIFLCFTNTGAANTGNISMLNMAGSDTAIFPYAWGNTAYDPDNQKQFAENYYQIAQSASNSLETEQAGAKGESKGLDLLALAAVGFNDIGWAQRRHPLISDDDFEEILIWFRDEYMPKYKDDEDSWKQYFIQFDTWNEYGEGHYIYPTVGLDPIPGTDYKGYGQYGYLEAMAKVFGKNYDAELHKELDITPTMEQKNRLGHLYVPNKRMYIRREFLPDSMMETPIPEHETVSIKFNKSSSVSLVSEINSFYETKPVYNSREKAIEMTTRPASSGQSNPDPIIQFNESSVFSGVSAADCNIFHVRMKTTKSGTPGQLFFRVDTMPKNDKGQTYYSEDYQYTFNFKEAGVWQDYYIDLKSHEGFTGTIQSLRFDPGNLADNTILISEIEFLKFSDEQKRTDITIDSHPYYPTDYWEIQKQSREEIYIAPTDDNNFYKALHIVYDWNENTGILDLDTPNGTTLRFTIGSDKVIINGTEEETLSEKMYVYDGAPVIPLIYLLNKAGINYVYDFENKKLDITVKDPIVYEKIENSNAEDESLSDAFYSLNDSAVSIITDPDYDGNKVWQIKGGDNSNSYFVTDADFVSDVEYTLSLDIKLLGLEGGSFMASQYPLRLLLVYSDGTEVTDHVLTAGNAKYGKWSHIEYKFTIPSSLVKDDAVVEKIGVYIEPDDWEECSVSYVVDNFNLRRLPETFKFRNGDAEDEDMSMWYASNTNINRVWDDEMNSWVLELTPFDDGSSAWSYIRQGTTFEPGVTYYFSYDAKMGVNSYGTPVTTSFAINFRFADLLQAHFTQNNSDHSITNYNVSQNDGWKHYSGSFTVSAGYTDGGVVKIDGVWVDEITWYVNPLQVNGKYSPMSLRLDNIKFSTSPLE
ncbi:MAG: hypothetical protein E7600_08595 [Ruminococcaceae bacterium]|nr:hypothetical protein [Oscillospiraceae bacterium]